jgi:hypothetical protein
LIVLIVSTVKHSHGNEYHQQQDIKKTIRKTYRKIALQESNSYSGSSSSSCCAPGCCSSGRGTDSPMQATTVLGYDMNELASVPQASILGVGCGAPLKFADLQKGETIVDLGSGAGIDVLNSDGQPWMVWSLTNLDPGASYRWAVNDNDPEIGDRDSGGLPSGVTSHTERTISMYVRKRP